MKAAPSDSLAPSGAPSSALRIWPDTKGNLYVEIPGAKGPYIECVNFDHRGIAHLFTLCGLHRIDYEYTHALPSGYSNFTKGTETDRAMADRILKQMGLIK